MQRLHVVVFRLIWWTILLQMLTEMLLKTLQMAKEIPNSYDLQPHTDIEPQAINTVFTRRTIRSTELEDNIFTLRTSNCVTGIGISTWTTA